MEKLKAAVIGAGGIAQHAHIPALAAMADDVALTAVADVNGERARFVAAKYGFARAYTDYEEMLAREAPDVVVVSTPNKFHAPIAIAALQAGCHVLCEKPPAMSPSEALSMTRAASKAGKVLTFALHNRFKPEVQALKRFVDAGELGFVYAARVEAIRRRGIPGWGVFTNQELQGGGALVDIGVHMLDAALYLMGYPQPVQALAKTFQEIGKRPGVGTMGEWDWKNFSVEDLALAMIKFDNGAVIMLESSFAQNVAVLEKHDVRLSGREGGATLFPLRIFKELHGGLYDYAPAWIPDAENAYAEQMRHFVAACRGERPPMVQPAEALILQQTLSAIYKSAAADDAVHVQPLGWAD